MFDKFHEECGVMAVYGHPEAAKLAYLGLYAFSIAGRKARASVRATALARLGWRRGSSDACPS